MMTLKETLARAEGALDAMIAVDLAAMRRILEEQDATDEEIAACITDRREILNAEKAAQLAEIEAGLRDFDNLPSVTVIEPRPARLH